MSLRDRRLLTRGIHLIIMNNDMFHWADFVDIFNIEKTEFLKINQAGEKINRSSFKDRAVFYANFSRGVDIDNADCRKSTAINQAGEKIYDIIIQNQELIKEKILNSEYYKSRINCLTKGDFLLKIETEKQDKVKLMSDRELLEEIYRLLTK